MAQQPSENKKLLDFSSLPRGAIGIKGLPVSRNTRLPSIRSPRDLTLGAPPKRTFMPNIPVRREKKSQMSENVLQVKQETGVKIEGRNSSSVSDRGRGRGRGKVYIQTQGSIFSEGIGSGALSRKEKVREAYQKSDYSTSARGVSIKKEKDDTDIAGVSRKMDQLLRDDFIDDADDINDNALLKPVIFPPVAPAKKEVKCDLAKPIVNFDPNIAKEMDFDVNRVAKFIKKEKGTEIDEEKKPVASQVQSNQTTNLLKTEDDKKSATSSEILSNEITNILNTDPQSSKLVLLKLPQFINITQKMEESNTDAKISDNQNLGLASIKCLPEGYIGKLQTLKSGKTRLLVGPVEYTLDSVCSLRSAKHELVSINANASSGDLCVLGCVNDMLKFVPNEDSLLH